MTDLAPAMRRRELFGVPGVLSATEARELGRDLKQLWYLTYGSSPTALNIDLQLCKRLFDPIARGQTLRDRLAALPLTPVEVVRSLARYGRPLVVQVNSEMLIVGPEGRVILEILEREREDVGHVVVSLEEIAAAEHRVLELYRGWATARLLQVIDLQSGRGAEVMQGIAVGVTISLLVNRSDTLEKAIIQRNASISQSADGDTAIFAAAERFAEIVSKSRSGRSASERRLRGGYALTEARRRLGGKRLVIDHSVNGQTRIYIPASERTYVIGYVGQDLARRTSLDVETLGAAFDGLVESLHEVSGRLSRRAMAFDRPADTRKLKRDLIGEFERARSSNY